MLLSPAFQTFQSQFFDNCLAAEAIVLKMASLAILPRPCPEMADAGEQSCIRILIQKCIYG